MAEVPSQSELVKPQLPDPGAPQRMDPGGGFVLPFRLPPDLVLPGVRNEFEGKARVSYEPWGGDKPGKTSAQWPAGQAAGLLGAAAIGGIGDLLKNRVDTDAPAGAKGQLSQTGPLTAAKQVQQSVPQTSRRMSQAVAAGYNWMAAQNQLPIGQTAPVPQSRVLQTPFVGASGSTQVGMAPSYSGGNQGVYSLLVGLQLSLQQMTNVIVSTAQNVSAQRTSVATGNQARWSTMIE